MTFITPVLHPYYVIMIDISYDLENLTNVVYKDVGGEREWRIRKYSPIEPHVKVPACLRLLIKCINKTRKKPFDQYYEKKKKEFGEQSLVTNIFFGTNK